MKKSCAISDAELFSKVNQVSRTIRVDSSTSRQFRLIANDDDRSILGEVLSPQVVEDFFGKLETGT